MRQVTRKGLITVAAAGGVLALGGAPAHADATGGSLATHSPGVLSGNSVQVPVHVPVNACGNTVNVVGVLNPAFGNRCGNASHGKKTGQTGQGAGRGGAHAGGGAHHSPGVGSGNTVQVPIDAPVNVCGNSVSVGGLGNPAFGNECGNGSPATPPGKPQQPGNPGNPGTPGQPGNPGTPGEPGHPGTPGNPGQPGTPGHPGNPGHPGAPGTPHTPPERAVTPPPAPGTHTPGARGVSSERAPGRQAEGTGELARTGAGSLALALPLGAGMLLAGSVLYRRARAGA
ncbi:chaplin family protein [Streptomyces hebeiensis]